MQNSNYYDGREQALVKHRLLEKYLEEWAYRVGREWDKLVYVDGLAGPWKVASDDFTDTSFGVATRALKKAQNGLSSTHNRQCSVQSFLVGLKKADQEKLESFAAKHRKSGFEIETLQGEFADQIVPMSAKITADKKSEFRFVFLDPKGWKEIPMDRMVQFLHSRGCEVLVNLMTSRIRRFLEEADREASYRSLFGRDGVLERIRNFPTDQRDEQVVLEYAKSLQELCGFKYVSAVVVLEPREERVLYYLVFATNHPKGIQVFKDAEMEAADLQNTVRIETRARKDNAFELALDGDGQKTQLVLELRDRFCLLARRAIFQTLQATGRNGVPYAHLYCKAMFFPLVTPADLLSWIQGAPAALSLVLAGSAKRKKPSPDELGDTVSVVDLTSLRAAFKDCLSSSESG